ncbi:hypothetical protein HN011_011968 [Eciton burchellii]|nr:hypothetical protein HN011_011968 [Eciton burchellii]
MKLLLLIFDLWRIAPNYKPQLRVCDRHRKAYQYKSALFVASSGSLHNAQMQGSAALSARPEIGESRSVVGEIGRNRVTGGFEACRDAKKERLRRGRVGEGGGEARVRECRRDISESSGAFGAIVGSPPSGFDAEADVRAFGARGRVPPKGRKKRRSGTTARTHCPRRDTFSATNATECTCTGGGGVTATAAAITAIVAIAAAAAVAAAAAAVAAVAAIVVTCAHSTLIYIPKLCDVLRARASSVATLAATARNNDDDDNNKTTTTTTTTIVYCENIGTITSRDVTRLVNATQNTTRQHINSHHENAALRYIASHRAVMLAKVHDDTVVP